VFAGSREAGARARTSRDARDVIRISLATLTQRRPGWEVLVADAQKVKGLAPLACKTDKIDSGVLAELSFRDLVPAIWLPTLELRREREISRGRLHLVKHRSTLKNRVHSTLITFGHQRHMSDLFGAAGRRLLGELDIPEPWRAHGDASWC
jgi:transposase